MNQHEFMFFYLSFALSISPSDITTLRLFEHHAISYDVSHSVGWSVSCLVGCLVSQSVSTFAGRSKTHWTSFATNHPLILFSHRKTLI